MIQRELQNPLAQMLLEGRIHDGERVPVTVTGGKLAIGQSEQAEAAD